jgi:hypothetical protein
MCILFILLLISPRLAAAVWWIFQPTRWDLAFSSIIWPILGIIFLPWTTLMYVIVSPGGVTGWDWMWVGLMLFADIVSLTTSGYKNKDKIPGVSSSSSQTGGNSGSSQNNNV